VCVYIYIFIHEYIYIYVYLYMIYIYYIIYRYVGEVGYADANGSASRNGFQRLMLDHMSKSVSQDLACNQRNL
jgi:hypothetical protein